MVDLSLRIDASLTPQQQLQRGLTRTAVFVALFCAVPGVAALLS
ncbi:hypothetical protein [Aeromicrobium alkaliterrae]|uniref:Uncharacterized protein n=1 Tax=Aeromicrobium alkaliterrae TaxID=302168 RepID=A0ABN2JZH4_9ACTN